MLTFTEPAVVSLRNMSPALAHGSVFCKLVTLAVIVPSPSKVVLAKLNWSAAFQISEPPPLTVQLPLLYAADPPKAGEPMSASLQPEGRAAQVGAAIARRTESKQRSFASLRQRWK